MSENMVNKHFTKNNQLLRTKSQQNFVSKNCLDLMQKYFYKKMKNFANWNIFQKLNSYYLSFQKKIFDYLTFIIWMMQNYIISSFNNFHKTSFPISCKFKNES